MTVSAEMPRYTSHKEVHALQIGMETLEILPDGGARLTFMDQRFAPLVVGKEVISRYLPRPGDYLVVYADGYQSISPQKAFEEGYSQEPSVEALRLEREKPLRIRATELAHDVAVATGDFRPREIRQRFAAYLSMLRGDPAPNDQVS